MDGPPQLLPGHARTRLVERFGSAAEVWCDELPGLIDVVTRAWRLSVNTVLPGSANSVALSCISYDDEAFVLKVTPDLTVAAEEAAALSVWTACQHVVALADSDLTRGALLLESIPPGEKLSDDPDAGPWRMSRRCWPSYGSRT